MIINAPNSTIDPQGISTDTALKEQALKAHQRAEQFQKQHKWRDAIVAYQRAIALNGNFSWSHHNLGLCYQAEHQFQKAAEAFRQSISLNPKFIWSYYNLANVLVNQGHWIEAAQAYREILTLEPDTIQVPPHFTDVLQQLIKQDPRNPEYYTELAQQLIVQNKIGEGIGAYHMAIHLAPDDKDLSDKIVEHIRKISPGLADRLNSKSSLAFNVLSNISAAEDLQNYSLAKSILIRSHLFDSTYYQLTNPIPDGVNDFLDHYLRIGRNLGYQPNPLFNVDFYQNQYSEISQLNIDPLAHYASLGFQQDYDPSPFFSTRHYYEAHPEISAAGLNPLDHYLAYGAHEGTKAFSIETVQHFLRFPTSSQARSLKCWRGGLKLPSSSISIGLYCHSQGNYFITEIADFITEALIQAGFNVLRLCEKDEIPESLQRHWVIAPHEFFYLDNGHQWSHKQEWLSNVVMVNVEQPQTTWFSKAFFWMRHARVIFDINSKTAEILQKLGLPAYWLPLGHLKKYKPFQIPTQLSNLLALRGLSPQIRQHLPDISTPLVQRPLDIYFVGTLNPRREHFFSTNAHWLSQYRNFFHIPPMGVPLIQGEDQALNTEAVIGLSRRSKILLNIHRDNVAYFEWHRLIFHGLWQKTLVVTEPCHDIPGLIAGEHFVESPLSKMRETLQWLLSTPDGIETAESIRQSGYQQFLSQQFDGQCLMKQAVSLAEQILNNG